MEQVERVGQMGLAGQINRKNILVIGDAMLDQYFCGRVKRISPEAPVPVLLKDTQRCVPGGAANVAANLAACGQNAFVMSAIGEDAAGDTLLELLEQGGIDAGLSIRDARSTTVKTRFLADGHQQLLRMDTEVTDAIPDAVADRLLAKCRDAMRSMDLIILSDYQKGLLTFRLVQKIIKAAGQMRKKVLIDVKDPDAGKYQGAYLLKPNLKELRALTGMAAHTDGEIEEASRKLMQEAGCRYVLTTCGARGMVLAGEDLTYRVKPAGKEVFDVTGAGDTVIAYLAACLANGFRIQDAVLVADYAAGVKVAKAGTAAVRLGEVREAMERELPVANKIRDKNQDKDQGKGQEDDQDKDQGQGKGQEDGQDKDQGKGQEDSQDKGQGKGQEDGQDKGQGKGQEDSQNQGKGQDTDKRISEDKGQNTGKHQNQDKDQGTDKHISKDEGQNKSPPYQKKLSSKEAASLRQRYRDRKIVFTNGCFDILHAGHVRCLQEAATFGDILVVGLNADASVRRLKGNGRPVNGEADRAELLCALSCVDYVAVFAEDTPQRLIDVIQPDVLVKGGDYKLQEVAGRETVEARGGVVKILPFVEGKSTTEIISRVEAGQQL